MVVPSYARGSVASALSPNIVPRSGTTKIFAGVFGSNTQQGIIYKWCFLASSVSINFILPTSLVAVVSPSAFSRVTNLGISGPVNNHLWLLIMAVAELSTTKGVLYISHEKESLIWAYAVANALTYIVSIGLHFARRNITWLTIKFLLSLAKIEENMNLDQCRMNPLTTWYKYINSIRVSESIDLSAPSGGLGNHSKRKMHEISKFNGSS